VINKTKYNNQPMVIKNPEYLKSDQKIKQNTTAKTNNTKGKQTKNNQGSGWEGFFFYCLK